MISHLNCYLLAYSSDLISFGDDLELAIERLEELDEVFGLSLMLHEALVLIRVLLKHVRVRIVLVVQ